MSHIILGLFNDTKHAGDAVSELKELGYTKEISIMAYDAAKEKTEVHEVKKSSADGAGVGSTVGGVAGAIAALLSGITAVTIPGIGILVGGPLAVLLGVSGGVVGSLAGGLVGGLVDLGLNEPTAHLYEDRLKRGDVLIGVSVEDDMQEEVRSTFRGHGANEITVIEHE